MDGVSSPLEGNQGNEILTGVSTTQSYSTTVDLVEPPKPTAAGGNVTLEEAAISTTPPENVNLSGVEPTPGQLSNVGLVSPPPVTLSGSPIVDLQAPSVNIDAELGNQSLEGAAIKPAALTQVTLDESPVSAGLDAKSVSLEEAKISQEGLTNVNLTASESKGGNLESIPLDGPAIPNVISPKTANVSGVENTLQSNLIGNENLSGPTIDTTKLGQVDLQETVSGFKDPGNVNLGGPDTDLESNSYVLGKELFGKPKDDKKIILGKESLDGPTKNLEQNSEDLGNQNLKEPPVNRRPNTDNADLQ
jgi:uncharacterized protein YjbI with pentapeptide repeats